MTTRAACLPFCLLILSGPALGANAHTAAPAPYFNWTGCYIGGHAGGGWGSTGFLNVFGQSEGAITQLQNQITQTQSQIAISQNQMALLQTQLATLIATNTFGQNTPAIIATEAEIAALKAQIAASQTQATQLENQLERARAIGGINTAHTTNTTGFVGGGQGGCNYQLSHLVIGVEADVSGTAMAGSSGSVFGGHTSANTDFITDVTGRLGYAAGPWLIYAKGGAAWSDSSFSFTASTGAPWTWSGIRSGWTAGTGIEWAFLQSWSAKLEYQYYDFASSGTLTSPASTIALGNYVQYIHTIKLGFNWHLYTGASPRH